MPTVAEIDACLPQTQCTKCSYPGCLEYAQAIHAGDADINQCPPGGEVTISLLADILQRPVKPLNTEFGEHTNKHIARIIEKDCIGCMLCIKACPVDAIIGANKMMHSIIDAECTGCELCLPPCPMDCIEMVEYTQAGHGPWDDYAYVTSNQSRNRRKDRLDRLDNKQKVKSKSGITQQIDRKKIIEEAIKRAKSKSG